MRTRTVSAEILTADAIDAHNTFDSPDTVRPEPFTAMRLQDGTLSMTLPAKSIVMMVFD